MIISYCWYFHRLPLRYCFGWKQDQVWFLFLFLWCSSSFRYFFLGIGFSLERGNCLVHWFHRRLLPLRKLLLLILLRWGRFLIKGLWNFGLRVYILSGDIAQVRSVLSCNLLIWATWKIKWVKSWYVQIFAVWFLQDFLRGGFLGLSCHIRLLVLCSLALRD